MGQRRPGWNNGQQGEVGVLEVARKGKSEGREKEWAVTVGAPFKGLRRCRLIQNLNQTNSNGIQFLPNFDQSKKNLFERKFFEIKYGCEGFEERNNFPHRNFFIFEMECN
jgi:hypothetical protein